MANQKAFFYLVRVFLYKFPSEGFGVYFMNQFMGFFREYWVLEWFRGFILASVVRASMMLCGVLALVYAIWYIADSYQIGSPAIFFVIGAAAGCASLTMSATSTIERFHIRRTEELQKQSRAHEKIQYRKV